MSVCSTRSGLFHAVPRGTPPAFPFWLALAAAIVLLLPERAPAQLRQPDPPRLSAQGYQLILDFEVGGGESYFARHLARPTWPGAASGVTIGVGYDLGYNSAAVIRADWIDLESAELERLAATAGRTGPGARQLARELRDILIGWNLAETVFQRVTLARFAALTARTFPGWAQLQPNAQAALVSLVFNRGSSLAGGRRVEMRRIRDHVARRDYRAIALELRSMKRHWRGTDIEAGMLRRREAEAQLVETCR